MPSKYSSKSKQIESAKVYLDLEFIVNSKASYFFEKYNKKDTIRKTIYYIYTKKKGKWFKNHV